MSFLPSSYRVSLLNYDVVALKLIFCLQLFVPVLPVCQENKYLAIDYLRVESAQLTFRCCSFFTI